jgi:hypothetical protein
MKARASFLFLTLLFFSLSCFSQKAYLFIKKKGKKLETFIEGSQIRFQTRQGEIIEGKIMLLRNDTIYLNRGAVSRAAVAKIFMTDKQKIVTARELLYLSIGTVIVAAGLTLSGWEDFDAAVVYAVVTGYGQLLINIITRVVKNGRSSYRIGKKLRLQVLDFYR